MTKTFNSGRSLPLPPGSMGLPLIGESLSFLKDRDFIKKRQEKYGSIFKSHIFGRPTVFVVGADANYFVLSQENKYFVSAWPQSTRTLLGSDSLTIQLGSIHTSRRKLMYQAFQPRSLASYIPTIERITTQYLHKWQQLKTFTWYPELRNYTFDIAAKLFVGTENASQIPLVYLFEIWCAGLFSLPLNLPWTKYSQALSARKKLLKLLEKIILERQQNGLLGEDALGLLLQAKDEDNQGLSLGELKEQILLLLFAGHETLTSAIASFCLLVGQDPEVLCRIREEQKQFSLSEPLSLDQLKQMTYLEQVLKEVLRFVPPVAGVFREVIADCEFAGYLLPKGWLVQVSIAKTHQQESIYQDHDKFDPDRFSSARLEDKKKPFGYIPFGGGLRECLGKEFARLEMKVFAALIARNYHWELLPNQDLSMTAIPTPHPRDELKVNFY